MLSKRSIYVSNNTGLCYLLFKGGQPSLGASLSSCTAMSGKIRSGAIAKVTSSTAQCSSACCRRLLCTMVRSAAVRCGPSGSPSPWPASKPCSTLGPQ